MLLSALWRLCSLGTASAAVTVYGQIPFGQTSAATSVTATGSSASPTNAPPGAVLAAYDETVLRPPNPPQDQALSFTLNLAQSNASVAGLSIMQHGSFYGFSIEMSVVTQIMGKNASHLQVPFLNLMGLIQQRSGGINIRVGGNTQDFAVYVDSIPDGHATTKEKSDLKNPTLTPAVLYTKELFYIASNISSLVNVKWYFGIPFNDTNWRLQIAEHGQAILGDNLLGLQGGNEPDYYLAHGHRNPGYGPFDYFGEFGDLITAIRNNPNIPRKNILIGPSLASGPWTPEQMWETGYLDAYKDSLVAVTMEHYPSNNCFVRFNIGSYVDPQATFPSFLTHQAALNFVQMYRNTSNLAREAGKPFIMFETNTATCGGLPGISDSFGAALWGIDMGLTMAATNFSHALLHVGGQNVYYNPFTAPPTNQTTFNQWTVGAVYYSVLVVAEVFGKSNVSQIVDTSNNGPLTPSYAIYDNGALSKVALLNFMNDPSGAHDITATITVNGGQVPQEVHVKYLAAESVSVKTNITWAGQTLGNKFKVDGRLKGSLDIIRIACDQSANLCRVPVKAPGFALVFMTDPTRLVTEEALATFQTTAYTKTMNTATVDPSVLATSNGHSEKERMRLGSTSPGSVSGTEGLRTWASGVTVLLALLSGGMVVLMASAR
ncbi:putative glycosyl hydrolase family 79 C-terminal beta domain [Lyophyllum shimeji]|uniref:Glycosyl hydrolase family 79 C-terminal beta domain n=1 Tax=Lyophyllum shimeji TaxID=47721 RepID=A0A9P3Q0A3_LYOSH|nr:putative glycosyl hydrolase family 79 C-terminal beta domain [Lyophyllum shimeji]